MTTETILKQWWNWQITIPKNWRTAMWTDRYRAVFDNNKIFIEPIANDIELDIKSISMDELNDETVACIKESEVQYKAWNKDYFISHDDFWKDV
jgi:hypothetical protein